MYIFLEFILTLKAQNILDLGPANASFKNRRDQRYDEGPRGYRGNERDRGYDDRYNRSARDSYDLSLIHISEPTRPY